jgi:hypothetical protein
MSASKLGMGLLVFGVLSSAYHFTQNYLNGVDEQISQVSNQAIVEQKIPQSSSSSSSNQEINVTRVMGGTSNNSMNSPDKTQKTATTSRKIKQLKAKLLPCKQDFQEVVTEIKVPVRIVKSFIRLLEKKGILKHMQLRLAENQNESGFIIFESGHSQPELFALEWKYNSSRLGKVTENIFRGSWAKSGIVGTHVNKSEKVKKVVTEALKYYENLSPEKSKLPTVELKSEESTKQMIEKFLKEAKGICVGESHWDGGPKKFLIDHMGLFKQLGVTTLFMEHITSSSMQDILDDYLNGPETKLPPILREYIECLSERCGVDGKYDFEALIVAAKKAGIRIVGVESDVSLAAGKNKKLKLVNFTQRVQAMNYEAKKIIDREMKGDERFIALLGSAHLVTINNNGDQCLGVANLTNSVAMLVRGCGPKENSHEINTKPFELFVDPIHVEIKYHDDSVL